MKKILMLLILSLTLFGSSSVPGRVSVKQECYLRGSGPFMETHEVALFNVTVENENFLPNADAIQEIRIWADGQTYPIKSTDAQVSEPQKKSPERKNNQLYGDELKAIANAGFLKLWVKYKNQINEEHSSEGTTPYFTMTKTTVQTERYLPLTLDRSAIAIAINECSQGLAADKRQQRMTEIAIAIGAFILMTVLILAIRRFRKRKISPNG